MSPALLRIAFTGIPERKNLRKIFAALKECYKLLRPSLNILVHSIPVGNLSGDGESVNISLQSLSHGTLRVTCTLATLQVFESLDRMVSA